MNGEILYVDDQAMLTSPLREFIGEEIGRRVLYAPTIKAALRAIDNHDIALVLLDVSMATGDTKALRKADPSGKSTGLLAAPILRQKLKIGADIWLITVRASELTEKEVQAAGIQKANVFGKPTLNLNRLLNKIRTFLGC